MEIYEKEPVSLYLSDLVLLAECNTNIQKVQVFEHNILGKVLVINDEIQNIEKWSPFYHEAITHIPMMFLKSPSTILILGGGDLYAANILLQYPSVNKIVICDHDSNVIKMTEKYYLHAQNVISDSRVQIIFQDAKQFISTCKEKFDLIIDDCFNLVMDFSEEDNIFGVLNNLLVPDTGVCCSLLYRHIFDKYIMNTTKTRLFDNYKTVLSLVTVPEYPGILHILAMWGKSVFLTQNLTESMNTWHITCSEKKIMCGELFDPKFCQFYLYLPSYIKSLL